MLPSIALLTLLAPLAAIAHPTTTSTTKDVNPFLGKNYYANSHYANELKQTKASFLKRGDFLNAARVTTVQRTGTFVWISSVANLSLITTSIAEARLDALLTWKPQIVQLVLYDLPDRDCSSGDSAGEFTSANDGLNKYKTQYVDKFAKLVSKAPDLTFAIILEPDSLGNVITNQAMPACDTASPIYEEGIAYAISKLQFPNVHLYIDAAHGGWLGWPGNLPLGMVPSLRFS
jgi:cellulose 1,4-beta-cellobiosidase